MTYDDCKLESAEDEYARQHPEWFRRGVAVTRMTTAEITVEVEASSEEDARFDAVIAAKGAPFGKWMLDEDDCDTTDIEPSDRSPGGDPDAARDDMQDRERS
jgi:hypothetical protein